MAHSDALIFLTNITWIFFLFLFTYFFFVLFFLPTLYKKFRARVILRDLYTWFGVWLLKYTIRSWFFFMDILTGSFRWVPGFFQKIIPAYSRFPRIWNYFFYRSYNLISVLSILSAAMTCCTPKHWRWYWLTVAGATISVNAGRGTGVFSVKMRKMSS